MNVRNANEAAIRAKAGALYVGIVSLIGPIVLIGALFAVEAIQWRRG